MSAMELWPLGNVPLTAQMSSKSMAPGAMTSCRRHLTLPNHQATRRTRRSTASCPLRHFSQVARQFRSVSALSWRSLLRAESTPIIHRHSIKEIS
eukprot:6456995-Amphidinium_carterae.1